MDEMSHFDRERIPERVVHAKGAGRSHCSKQCTSSCDSRLINVHDLHAKHTLMTYLIEWDSLCTFYK